MAQTFEHTWSLLKRFEQSRLPRHTSYPPANRWSTPPTPDQLEQALEELMQEGESLCLYLHVPFCARLCHYCGCSRVVAAPQSPRARSLTCQYVQAIVSDLHTLHRTWPELRFKRLHLGGGTPNYLSADEFRAVMTAAAPLLFCSDRAPSPDGTAETSQPTTERSIEIDPRTLSEDFLSELGKWAFTHASLGIQDFDPEVQKAIGREQPLGCVEQAVRGLREQGVRSLNFDLIYGLPEQKLTKAAHTGGGFTQTIEQTLALRPDRISLFRLALMVEQMPWQKPLLEHPIPTGREAVELFLSARQMLLTHGYVPIGLDHFALPHDPLARAREQGTLVRTFQGMSTESERHVLGLGPTAISCLSPRSGTVYAQQVKDTRTWLSASRRPEWPRQGWLALVEGGHVLSAAEDLLRTTISSAYARDRVDTGPLFSFWEQTGQHAALERVTTRLRRLQEDAGLITWQNGECTYGHEAALLLRRVLASCLDPAVRDEDIFPSGSEVRDTRTRDASLVL